MSTVRYLLGDVRDRINDLPDASVALIVTSPPFLALRSYLPADHPMKHAEIGSEPDPATFIDCLLAQVAQWSRVLAPWGSIAVELGDTFAGSGGAGGDYNADGLREGQEKFNGSARRSGLWPLAKSACFIPELFGIALTYGINPLRGAIPATALLDYIDRLTASGVPAADAIESARQWLTTAGDPSVSPAGRWRVRNKIMWCRPNPPVGALGDKFRPATSMIVVATRDTRRWFDLDAVRGALSEPDRSFTVGKKADGSRGNGGDIGHSDKRIVQNPTGAPPLDWHIDDDGPDGWDIWRMATQPYTGSHYATFPTELPRRLILSMCAGEVCLTCGEPRRRIVAKEQQSTGRTTNGPKSEAATAEIQVKYDIRTVVSVETLGWSDCGCGDGFVPGVVLDPFAGSGTTLAVAAELGRYAIGIDIDSRNVQLARQRVGGHVHIRAIDVQYGTEEWWRSPHGPIKEAVTAEQWRCEPRLPAQADQIDGQLNLLGELT